jgi:sugar/nucleoside kinase (ribokinase family)
VDNGNEVRQIPFTGFTLEGRAGRGDTCTAAFLVARERGMNLREATVFAAEVTSRKMQYRGPFRG